MKIVAATSGDREKALRAEVRCPQFVAIHFTHPCTSLYQLVTYLNLELLAAVYALNLSSPHLFLGCNEAHAVLGTVSLTGRVLGSKFQNLEGTI